MKLKRLVFNDCYVRCPNTVIHFSGIYTHLQELEDLRIEFCNWFSKYDLVSFSKVANLKRLSIRGCSELKQFVQYASLATRIGFKKLESLDLRETPIVDCEFQCFNKLESLKDLLVECPNELRPQTLNTMSTLRRLRPRRPDRVSRNIQPGEGNTERVAAEININGPNNPHLFIIFLRRSLNNYNNNSNRDNEPLPLPQFHELGLGREREQLENAFRAILPQGGNNNGNDNCPHHDAPRQITDRGVCSYGIARVPVQNNIVIFGNQPRRHDTNLEKLTIRHYRNVSDASLRHLVQCAPKLKLLDVTGCGVTLQGVNAFKEIKPECVVISDYPTE